MKTFDAFVVDIYEARQHDELVVDDVWESNTDGEEEDMSVNEATVVEFDDELHCFVDSQERMVLGLCASSYLGRENTPPPCISYANVRNCYGPYAHCSLDKGVACAQHIQLLAHTCACAWYECTLTSAHISKCMQTQESLGNMKSSGSHPCWHKQ